MTEATEWRKKPLNVFGLVTLIKQKKKYCTEDYALCNSPVVIDADYVICRLMSDIANEHYYLGGNYDVVRDHIETFLKLLSQCNVKPYFVFRGVEDKSTKKLNKKAEIKDYSQFPYTFRENFIDIIQKCKLDPKVEVVRLDYVDNTEVATIAKELKCPVIAHTNEYYLFDSLYIPFLTLKMEKAETKKFIPCKIYKSANFVRSMYNMDIKLLPLLAILLGGNPIRNVDFRKLFRQLNIQSNDFSVESLVLWLKRNLLKSHSIIPVMEEVFDSIGDQDGKEKTQSYILKIIMAYSNECSEYLKMFSDKPEKCVANDDIFKYKYRSCQYPKCFMNHLVHNQYVLKPLMEDINMNHAHTVSLEIIAAIFKILTRSLENISIYVRVGEEMCLQELKESTLSLPKHLPMISDIQHMNLVQRKQDFLRILKIQDDDFINSLDAIPDKWKLIVIALKYLMAKTDFNWSVVYAIILCKIVITDIDCKVGMIRSQECLKLYDQIPKQNKIPEEVFDIPIEDCLTGLAMLIPYFEVEEKLKKNGALLDRRLMHHISEYQSCMVHINYLNSLFNSPFEKNMLCESFNGTFLYNMANGIVRAKSDCSEEEFGTNFIENLLVNAQGILKHFICICVILKE